MPTPTLPPQSSSLSETARTKPVTCILRHVHWPVAGSKMLKHQTDEKMDHLPIQSFLYGPIFSEIVLYVFLFQVAPIPQLPSFTTFCLRNNPFLSADQNGDQFILDILVNKKWLGFWILKSSEMFCSAVSLAKQFQMFRKALDVEVKHSSWTACLLRLSIYNPSKRTEIFT